MKRINFARKSNSVVVHNNEGVDSQIGGEHSLGTGRYLFPCATTALGPAIMVVYMLRSVQGQSYEPVVGFQETNPFVVDEQAVGLQSVSHGLSTTEALLETNAFPIEFESHQHGFSPLPDEIDLVPGLFHGLANHLLQHVLRHAMAWAFREKRGLFQVETVGASHVAVRSCRLDQKGLERFSHSFHLSPAVWVCLHETEVLFTRN